MGEREAAKDGKQPAGTVDAVSWIEAALQAGLGASGVARPDLAREALREAKPVAGEEHLEAWLEAVALELQTSSAALVPDEMIEAIATSIMANRRQSLEAHRKIESRAIETLVRRP